MGDQLIIFLLAGNTSSVHTSVECRASIQTVMAIWVERWVKYILIGQRRPSGKSYPNKDGEIESESPSENVEAASQCSVDTCLHTSILARLGNMAKELGPLSTCHSTKIHVSFTDVWFRTGS